MPILLAISICHNRHYSLLSLQSPYINKIMYYVLTYFRISFAAYHAIRVPRLYNTPIGKFVELDD